MGDMADYHHDLMFDHFMDEPEDGDGPARTYRSCRCCGTRSLHWEFHKPHEAWRLYSEENKIHVCKKVKLGDSPKE